MFCNMTNMPRKGCQMRYRATFLAGLAVGFVAGTRAGRERYEQMKKLARKAVESPAVQNATRAAGEKATELTKVAKDKAATRVPRLTETAKNERQQGARAARPDTRPARR